MTEARVVVVGAGTAGITLAGGLRVHGHAGPIEVLGAEPHPPYSRPPLSKQVLDGSWPTDRAGLRTPDELDQLGITVHQGVRATGLDPARRLLTTTAGPWPYDLLVLAVGHWPTPPLHLARALGVHTVADAVALRQALARGGPTVVIGSGVLAQELASAAVKAGAPTTLIGRSGRLSLGQVGDLLTDELTAHHRDHGVELRLTTPATAVLPGAVQLADGTLIEAQTVVAAVGGRPDTDWLRGAIELTAYGAIRCDHEGRAQPLGMTAGSIFAIGDAAAWPHPVTGDPEVVPHQLSAVQQGLAVAATLAGADPEPAAEPFFWTELHGSRIQAYGRFEAATLTPIEDGVWAATTAGRVTGIVGWATPRAFRAARALVDQRQPLPEMEPS